MASDGKGVPTDKTVKRSAARVLGTLVLLLIFGVAAFAWGSLGYYTLDPGQAAIILRLGRHVTTVAEPGAHLHLPPPFETREKVNVGQIQSQRFGITGGGEGQAEGSSMLSVAMQTADNNIVHVPYVVHYKIQNAFNARYRVTDLEATLRDAAQGAMREVVARMDVDDVYSERREDVQADAQDALQRVLDGYEAGLQILEVNLQDVAPPEQVAAAFDDVTAAQQDASRTVNEAEGYRNEVLPNARAEAVELLEGAHAYRESKIADSTGEAERFKAVAAEYKKAPAVTRKRLYLETMEAILPSVEKVIIEQGTTNVLPYLPLGRTNGAPK